MSDSTQRGIFLVFEGIDGTGKSTQVERLRRALERAGESPVISREPTDGPWGRKIRESASTGRMSLAEELDAFIQDRTEHVNGLILPSLRAGRIVVLDRYFYSTIAYQGSRGADARALQADLEARFPIPDAVFLLDADPHLTVHRIAHDRGEQPNEFERIDLLEKARAVFNSLEEPNILRFDASVPADVLHERIWKAFLAGPGKRLRDRAETL